MGCKSGSAAAGDATNNAKANAANLIFPAPLYFAATIASLASGSSYDGGSIQESRAPHIAARPAASDSFLPPLARSARKGGRCHNEVFAEQTRVVTDGGKLNHYGIGPPPLPGLV